MKVLKLPLPNAGSTRSQNQRPHWIPAPPKPPVPTTCTLVETSVAWCKRRGPRLALT